MALMYAKMMMARLQNRTGKSLGEWGGLLASKKFSDREDVRQFLLNEGLDSEFIGFIFWTSHSRINYKERPVEAELTKKDIGAEKPFEEQGLKVRKAL